MSYEEYRIQRRRLQKRASAQQRKKKMQAEMKDNIAELKDRVVALCKRLDVVKKESNVLIDLSKMWLESGIAKSEANAALKKEIGEKVVVIEARMVETQWQLRNKPYPGVFSYLCSDKIVLCTLRMRQQK